MVDLLRVMSDNGIPLSAEIHQTEGGFIELWYWPQEGAG